MAEVTSASTPAEVPATENYFVRSRQLREIFGDEAYKNFRKTYHFKEVELTERGREMLRNGEWKWPAFRLSVHGMIAWLGEGILVNGTVGGLSIMAIRYFKEAGCIPFVELWTPDADGYDQLQIWASPNEATQATQTAVCDLLLQSLTRYKTTSDVFIAPGSEEPPCHSTCPFTGPALGRFLTQSLDIPGLQLSWFELDEEHCRALVATENARENFEIDLDKCRLTEAGERVLFNGIRRDRGPTSLIACRFNTQPLAEALRGNTHIKYFRSRYDDGFTAEDFLLLLRGLAGNLGIGYLDLSSLSINDESWSIMCQSLANHPAIKHLDLVCTACHDESSRPMYRSRDSHAMVMSVGRKRRRTQSLVDMLKVNTAITKIEIGSKDRDESVWGSEIEPRLEINKFRRRIVAVKKTKGTLRAPLFGRAVHAINDNDTFIFLMVQGNVDLLSELFPWAPHGKS